MKSKRDRQNNEMPGSYYFVHLQILKIPTLYKKNHIPKN